MAETKVFMLALVLSIATAVFMIVGFSTPYWVEQHVENVRGYGKTEPPVKNIGLWEMCFKNALLPKSNVRRYLDGCWYVFAKEYDDDRSILMPPWFVAVQGMSSLSLLIICIALLCMGFYYFRMCKREYETLIASYLLMFVSGLLTTVSAIVFGSNVGNVSWLPRTELTELSWSFALYIISAFFAVFSGMALIVSSIQYRIKYVV